MFLLYTFKKIFNIGLMLLEVLSFCHFSLLF